MDVNKKDLEATYSQKSDDELNDLKKIKTLTPLAKQVLDEEMQRRSHLSKDAFKKEENVIKNEISDSQTPAVKTDDQKENQVTIVGINIPFWSLVEFMVVSSIAAIPAIIILAIFGAILFAILGGLSKAFG